MPAGTGTPLLRGRRVGHGLLVAGAVGVAGSAGIHLHLWLTGYRYVHIIGPLFLAQVIAGFALALVLAAWRRPLLGLAAFGLVASTIGGFFLSLWFGLFNFHDSFHAPFAVTALVVELATLVLLAAGVWLRIDPPLTGLPGRLALPLQRRRGPAATGAPLA